MKEDTSIDLGFCLLYIIVILNLSSVVTEMAFVDILELEEESRKISRTYVGSFPLFQFWVNVDKS